MKSRVVETVPPTPRCLFASGQSCFPLPNTVLSVRDPLWYSLRPNETRPIAWEGMCALGKEKLEDSERHSWKDRRWAEAGPRPGGLTRQWTGAWPERL